MHDDRPERLRRARLYYVSASLHALEGALRGGVDLFQLRMKDAEDAAVLDAAARARELCAAHGALFLVNDRPDLAVAAGADGVHVGQDDGTVAEARTLAPGLLVGRSTHAPDQLAAAADADYAAVGPVHATPTKPGRAAVGLEYVRHAAAHAPAGLPWFAIGGLDAATLPDAVAAGARRAVVVRALDEAADPEAAARALRAALGAPVGVTA